MKASTTGAAAGAVRAPDNRAKAHTSRQADTCTSSPKQNKPKPATATKEAPATTASSSKEAEAGISSQGDGGMSEGMSDSSEDWLEEEMETIVKEVSATRLIEQVMLEL